ncbi:hypothetical protein [Chamaesiphon minutus]|uniref:Uncharacterized protein n=1 Tax=Chamaesiphon minutus (strain ATCC 27169 / PCC 6605) TaxID=1173020 RepID=K9UP50_CHAP6|nr:hypothetical protein [Chamaesiphon minutus]AFY96862.1 hypothetical protein Cha6605_6018 [Chamaesiphon minutus PCC 6605]
MISNASKILYQEKFNMSKIREELLDTIHTLIKTSRALPKEGSMKEMMLLLLAEIWDFLKLPVGSIRDYLKSLRLSRKSRISNIEDEHMSRLNRIVGYRIFREDDLAIFDNRIDEIKRKYPPQDLEVEVKEMKDSTDEHLEYQKDRNEILGSYLPVLGIAFITLLFIYVYGTEFIYSKQGSLVLALIISFFTCKNKFMLTYDISVAKHVKYLLERVESNI